MMPEKFKKLRQMEAFTDELFNRIVAFQSKEHAAWNQQAPFDERIKALTLHNLVFSCPDRDPDTTGPTVAHYYPLREENRALVYYAKQVAKAPVILDVHGRNGFVGSLLAREGAKVIGMRDPQEKPNQIVDFYDKDHYERRDGTMADVDFDFDVAFSAWMPSGQNVSPEIFKRRPRLVIFIYTEHVNEHSKQRQTGTDEAFTDMPDGYKVIDEWTITRPQNLMHQAWPDLSENIEEVRHVRIIADKPYHDVPLYAPEQMAEPYDWEGELEMALLTIEAKEHLRSQGIAV